MKKLFFSVLSLTLIAGLVLTSCEDEFTEEQALEQQRQILEALNNADNQNALALAQLDADNALDIAELNAAQQMAFQMYQDSLERLGPVVNYSVSVIAAGTVNTNARTEGEAFAPGATVTVVQGGVSRTETAGVGGVAIFGDMRIGKAIVTVSAPDHTTVTFATSLGESNFDLAQNNVETTIPLLPTTVAAGASQVSGTVYAQLNATTEDAEVVQGAIVRATLSVGDVMDDFGICLGCGGEGEIQTISYSNFTVVDTTGVDGKYMLVIPNALTDDGGGVSTNIEFLPYDGTQSFYAQQGDTIALVSKTVRFDPDQYGDGGAMIDTNLPGIWAEVSAPTGNAATGFALGSAARATDITESVVRVINGGTGYEVGDIFTFATGVDGDENPNDAYAYVEVDDVDANGRILDWSVTDNGALYVTSPGAPTPATADEITEIGFGTEPAGTGATFELLFVTYYDIFVANGGSGYSFLPGLTFSGTAIDDVGGGDVFVTVADDDITDCCAPNNMGSLNEGDEFVIIGGVIQANDNNGDTVRTFAGPFASAPTITVLPIEQRAAILPSDEIFLTEEGGIDFVDDFDDYGSGYATAPTVIFKSPTGMGSGATMIIDISNGEVNGWTITNPGAGYMDQINFFEDEPENVFNGQSQDDNFRFKPGQSTSNYNFNYQYGEVIE
jgi:hypothetical protein